MERMKELRSFAELCVARKMTEKSWYIIQSEEREREILKEPEMRRRDRNLN